jgi:hypothetical protein
MQGRSVGVITLPPLGSQFIEIGKNSAAAMLLGIKELTFQTQNIDRGGAGDPAAHGDFLDLLCRTSDDGTQGAGLDSGDRQLVADCGILSCRSGARRRPIGARIRSESGLVTGFTGVQIFASLVLPQALRNMLPALIATLVMMVKMLLSASPTSSAPSS